MYSSVYIHLPSGYLSHIGISLLTGFSDIGLKVFSNLSRSSVLGSPYASFDAIQPFFEYEVFPQKVDFYVVDVTQEISQEEIRNINNHISNRNVAILNMSDSANLSSGLFSKNFITFSAHCNRFARHGGDIRPLGFGVIHSLVEDSTRYNLNEKKIKIINNFNPTFHQSIRSSLELTLLEKLSMYFEIDREHVYGRRYFEKLARTVAVLAYCGEYYEDVRRHEYTNELIKDRPEFNFEHFECKVAIFRWDSFRFWEAALFACAPIQLNFHKYGMELPVLPIPWTHYIPIDLAEVSDLPDKIMQILRSDPLALHKIGKNAREWVLANYTPSAVAKHFISELVETWS
ncbi:MAG: glycosyltransferase [Anaerolineales bacterium]|nr:glycosyltransferase [Anaerolineales bacterium]